MPALGDLLDQLRVEGGQIVGSAVSYTHLDVYKRQEHITNELTGSITDNPELESWVDDRIDYRISRSRGSLRRPRS